MSPPLPLSFIFENWLLFVGIGVVAALILGKILNIFLRTAVCLAVIAGAIALFRII